MKRLFIGFVCSASAFAAMPAEALTYNTGMQSFVFEDSPAGPRTITYSFETTTDGTLGVLNMANIMSFSWSAWLDGETFTLNQDNSYLKLLDGDGLVATDTTLSFDPLVQNTRLGFYNDTLQETIQLYGTNSGLRQTFFIGFLSGDGGAKPYLTDPVFLGAVDTPSPSVPEPATWSMMIAGLGMAGAAMRGRKMVASVSFA